MRDRCLVLGSLVVWLSGCAADPPPAAPVPPAATVAVETPAPPANPTSSSIASAAPAPSAAPAAPRRMTAAEILATVPDGAGKIVADNGRVITIDKDGRIQIEDPNGKLGGSSSCGPNGIVYKRAVQLFAELQDALAEGSREKVEALMTYPLRLNQGAGKYRMFKDAAALHREFEQAFPARKVKEILAADPRALMCNASGFMLGAGAVWADNPKGKYGVFVINP